MPLFYFAKGLGVMEVGVSSVIEPESDGWPEEGRSVTMNIVVSVPAVIEPYFLGAYLAGGSRKKGHNLLKRGGGRGTWWTNVHQL